MIFTDFRFLLFVVNLISSLCAINAATYHFDLKFYKSPISRDRRSNGFWYMLGLRAFCLLLVYHYNF
ncbi:hypothetical protein BEL04_11245 [Mucilaginibacter sp. PPCGB 2223]|nr:hypothetical protein BEL04_11245 [Mucilaginibacter sp. PPCGB 2223]